MFLNEKGYYFTVLMYGLFSAVSLQKAVRDDLEGIPVTSIYYGISWFSTVLSILLLIIGLWNGRFIAQRKRLLWHLFYIIPICRYSSSEKYSRRAKRKKKCLEKS